MQLLRFAQGKWTPLHLSTFNGHLAVFLVLVQAGAAIDEENEVASCFAVDHDATLAELPLRIPSITTLCRTRRLPFISRPRLATCSLRWYC